MPGTAVGIQMFQGFPGTYSRNDNRLQITARPVNPTDTANINFGDPVVLIQNNTGGFYSQLAGFITGGGTFSFAPNGTSAFAGFAVREVKSFESYTTPPPSPTLAYYAPGSPADVMVQGTVSILLKNPQGTALVSGGPLFVRVTTNVTYPGAAVGDLEPAADGAHTVALTNCVLTTGMQDANGTAEVTMLSRNVP